jgi:hypothetical protein
MGLLSFARSIFQKSHRRPADSPPSHQHPSEPSSAVSTHGIQDEADVPLPPVRIAFSDDDDFETDVVGESFRQPALSALGARIGIDERGRRTFLAGLRAEPDNAFDRNAVAVLAADTGDHLGYLARDLAPLYQSGLLRRGGAQVPAILIGGGEGKPHCGVCLDLTALNEILGLKAPEKPPHRDAAARVTSPPQRPAPAPDPSFTVDVAPPFSTLLDGLASFEKADMYALKLADGRFHLLPYDAWPDPEAPVRLAQKRPEEWSVDDFARRARVALKTRRGAERHFLYNDLVQCLYRNRDASPHARSLCEALARQHIHQWPALAPSVKKALAADDPPQVPAFQLLATILAEREAYDEAMDICEAALTLGLKDGTKTGFHGRISRIKAKRNRAPR